VVVDRALGPFVPWPAYARFPSRGKQKDTRCFLRSRFSAPAFLPATYDEPNFPSLGKLQAATLVRVVSSFPSLGKLNGSEPLSVMVKNKTREKRIVLIV